MVCPKCGTTSLPNAEYCTNCGASLKEEQVSAEAAGVKKEAGPPEQAALVKRKWYQRMKPSPDGGAPGQEAKPYGCLIKLCLLLAAFAGILLVIWALVQMSVNDISTDAVSRGMCSYVFCKEDASTSYFAIGDGEIPPNPNYSASSHTYDRTNTDTWLEREKHTYLVPTEDGSYEVKTEKNWVEHEDTRITGTATYTNIAGLYCDLHKESGYHLIRGALNHRPYIQLAAGVALIAVCIAFGKRNMKKSRRYAVTAAAVAVVVLAAVVPSAALQTAHAEKLSYQYAGKLAAAGDYGEARAVYAALGDYKDSPEKLASVDQQIALARQEEAYNAAVALLDEEKYHEALAAFTKLGDFKDSAEQLSGVQEALYSEAVALAQTGEYDEAITTFTELGDYKDSADKLNEVYKQKAESLLADGKDTEAQELFTKIGYEDDYVKSIRYPEAEALLADGDKVHAAMAFGALGDYKDARSRSFALWDEIADRKTIATGGGQTVGLRSDGTVVAAGSNKYGQCNVSGWTDIKLPNR